MQFVCTEVRRLILAVSGSMLIFIMPFFGFILTLTEPTVRAELMEQVPHIAMFCQENRPSIPYAFSKYLLPIVVRYLADQNNQVSVL